MDFPPGGARTTRIGSYIVALFVPSFFPFRLWGRPERRPSFLRPPGLDLCCRPTCHDSPDVGGCHWCLWSRVISTPPAWEEQGLAGTELIVLLRVILQVVWLLIVWSSRASAVTPALPHAFPVPCIYLRPTSDSIFDIFSFQRPITYCYHIIR